MSYNDTITAVPGPSRQTNNAIEARFVRGFRESGGTFSSKCVLVHYEMMGTGMLAAEPIEEGELLFSIPRGMLLNLKNSALPQICQTYDVEVSHNQLLQNGSAAVENTKWGDVNVGWLGLMLTMMWERFRTTQVGSQALDHIRMASDAVQWTRMLPDGSNGEEQAGWDEEGAASSIGKAYRRSGAPRGSQDWGWYFDILPTCFDTPMFWSQEDLEELRGTSIPSKIGKEEATNDYYKKVRPYIVARAPVFFGALAGTASIEELIEQHYSLHQFHIMGSRILSRSFHVKDAKEGVMGEEGKEYDGNEISSAENEDDDDDEGDGYAEQEDIEAISMVPMADMLNARTDCDNAHVFYEPDRLAMRSTQRIEKGEQIWNTYGNPPSSDLLRRYGYVDLGNPSDVVEIGVQDLLQGCLVLELGVGADPINEQARRAALLGRIEWACSLGLDEEEALTYPFAPSSEEPYRPSTSERTSSELKEAAAALSEELLIQARLLCLSDVAFEKLKAKEKLPNGRVDAVEEHDQGKKATMSVAELLHQAIEERKKAYSTSLEEDEDRLYGEAARSQTLSLNQKNALVVRLSEKRILAETQKVLQAAMKYIKSKKREATQQNGRPKKQRT